MSSIAIGLLLFGVAFFSPEWTWPYIFGMWAVAVLEDKIGRAVGSLNKIEQLLIEQQQATERVEIAIDSVRTTMLR